MLVEYARVIAYQDGVATVECQTQSACGSCVAKSGCGTSALSALTGDKSRFTLQINTLVPLKIGQTVEIGLAQKAFLFSAFLLYVIPLIVLFGSTLLSELWIENELLRAVLIVLFTAFSFFVVRWFSRKSRHTRHLQPILLRVVA